MKLFRPAPRQLAPLNDDAREYDPTFTLDRFIAEGRAEMGEAKWQKLNQEWLA